MYRLTFDDDSTAIVYIWDDAENYWPAAHADDHADPFSHASGIALLQAPSRRLDTLGVRTPRIHLADQSRSHYPADIAVAPNHHKSAREWLLRYDIPAAPRRGGG